MGNRTTRCRCSTRGNVLAILIVILMLLAIVATGLASLAHFHYRMAVREAIYRDEFAIAEAVLAKAYAELRFRVENFHEPPDAATLQAIRPPVFGGYTVDDYSIEEVSSGTEVMSVGIWSNLSVQVTRYRIHARVRKQGGTAQRFEHPGVVLRQDLELRFIPLQMFGVFYYPDLELTPGPSMTISGRVHSNANVYVAAASSLEFKSYVSAVGRILHGTHPDSGMGVGSGDVQFWNGTTDVSMKNGDGTWLDHLDPNWATASQTRWNGYVSDESHNVGDLPLPIPKGEDPHTIIERTSAADPPSIQREKLENKAGLKILRDPSTGEVQGFDAAGSPVPLTYEDPGGGGTFSIVSDGTFYDQREAKWVQSLDVDMARLRASGIAPTNGILYVSTEGANGAVRLTNAQQLPSPGGVGFAVASDDALYLRGDFNTVNKTHALIAGDAIMIQSNNWDDAKSNNADMNVRKATPTTVNAVAFQGIVPTENVGGVEYYSGGLENYFRFMENWTAVTFSYSGSLVCMWECRKWIGRWRGWPVYRPPDRVWSWDPNLASNPPPGMPKVYQVVRRHWHIRNLGAS